MSATTTKISSEAPMGQYQPTSIDAAKAKSDFTIEAISGSITTIQWTDGRVEFVKGARAIGKLKATHNWMTNF